MSVYLYLQIKPYRSFAALETGRSRWIWWSLRCELGDRNGRSASLSRSPIDPPQPFATEAGTLHSPNNPHQPRLGHRSPEPAVVRLAAVVAHHESLSRWNLDRVREVALGAGTTSADVRITLADELACAAGLPVDVSGTDIDLVTGTGHYALDEVHPRLPRYSYITRRPARSDFIPRWSAHLHFGLFWRMEDHYGANERTAVAHHRVRADGQGWFHRSRRHSEDMWRKARNRASRNRGVGLTSRIRPAAGYEQGRCQQRGVRSDERTTCERFDGGVLKSHRWRRHGTASLPISGHCAEPSVSVAARGNRQGRGAWTPPSD
jgi:hypothetical protein